MILAVIDEEALGTVMAALPVREALKLFVEAAREWHNVHRHAESNLVDCDDFCHALDVGERALALAADANAKARPPGGSVVPLGSRRAVFGRVVDFSEIRGRVAGNGRREAAGSDVANGSRDRVPGEVRPDPGTPAPVGQAVDLTAVIEVLLNIANAFWGRG